MTGLMAREPVAERALALSRVPGCHMASGAALVDLAEQRAGVAPVDMRSARSMPREFVEECADAVNYAVWAARAGQVSQAAAAAACALIVEAYAVLMTSATRPVLDEPTEVIYLA